MPCFQNRFERFYHSLVLFSTLMDERFSVSSHLDVTFPWQINGWKSFKKTSANWFQVNFHHPKSKPPFFWGGNPWWFPCVDFSNAPPEDQRVRSEPFGFSCWIRHQRSGVGPWRNCESHGLCKSSKQPNAARKKKVWLCGCVAVWCVFCLNIWIMKNAEWFPKWWMDLYQHETSRNFHKKVPWSFTSQAQFPHSACLLRYCGLSRGMFENVALQAKAVLFSAILGVSIGCCFSSAVEIKAWRKIRSIHVYSIYIHNTYWANLSHVEVRLPEFQLIR